MIIDSASLQKSCAANVPFVWNEELQEELDWMKKAQKEHVKLSPLDTTKNLVVWCDTAPSVSMSYIIATFRDPMNESLGLKIIACDSTTFKKGKRSFSPFEAKLCLVHWGLKKEACFNKGARKILVCSETKTLADFLDQQPGP